MSQLIEDYALIGDTQTAALVGRDGSIDWLCLPRFDSGSCFTKLLGDDDHGRWLITADGPVSSRSRRYRGSTLVLETEIITPDGVVRVVDFMPPRHRHPRVVRVVRVVHGIAGEVRMRTELSIRFEYGLDIPWVRQIDRGLHAVAGPNAVCIDSPIDLRGRGQEHEATFTVCAGEETAFALSWFVSHEDLPFRLDVDRALKETVAYWEDWTDGIEETHGEWETVTRRSLITLKALTYSPTGGIVAAVTTSLPEALGGARRHLRHGASSMPSASTTATITTIMATTTTITTTTTGQPKASGIVTNETAHHWIATMPGRLEVLELCRRYRGNRRRR